MTDTHECVFVEEQEPAGRLILPPCLVCNTSAMDALQQMRDEVLAIHKADPTWTDSTFDETGIQVEQNALYDDSGELIAAPDYRLVCAACAPRCGVLWPCPTARAVGVTE